MNKENAKDYLPLVQALVDGKVIEVEEFPGRWVIATEVTFDAKAKHYRIKPEPREIWVNHYMSGSYVYDTELEAMARSAHDVVPKRYREVLE